MPTDVATATARLEEQVKGLYRLLDEREKQLNIAFTASQKAVDTALAAQQQVNSTQNEFRGTLSDQAARFATRVELELQIDRLRERLDLVEKADAGIIGRTGGITYMQALALTLVPILIASAALVWNLTR